MERHDVSFLCFRFILPALLFFLLNLLSYSRDDQNYFTSLCIKLKTNLWYNSPEYSYVIAVMNLRRFSSWSEESKEGGGLISCVNHDTKGSNPGLIYHSPVLSECNYAPLDVYQGIHIYRRIIRGLSVRRQRNGSPTVVGNSMLFAFCYPSFVYSCIIPLLYRLLDNTSLTVQPRFLLSERVVKGWKDGSSV